MSTEKTNIAQGAKYYSPLRPILPGGYPRCEKVLEIYNYGPKQFCEDIGRDVWGYIVYEKAIPETEAANYDLVSAETRQWFAVTSSFDDKGHVTIKITGVVMAAERPANVFKSLRRKDIYVDYFPTREEAEAFVKEAEVA